MIKQFNYIFKPEKDDDTCKTSFEFELKKINEISVDELEKAGCKRAISCAQQLSKALQQIIEKEFD